MGEEILLGYTAGTLVQIAEIVVGHNEWERETFSGGLVLGEVLITLGAIATLIRALENPQPEVINVCVGVLISKANWLALLVTKFL